MFLFRHLFRRMHSETWKRRIFDVERCCNNRVELKITNYSSESVGKPPTAAWQNNLIKMLQKIEWSLTRYHQTSIEDIGRALDLARSSRSFGENHALLLLKCCGDAIPTEQPNRRTELAEKIWSLMSVLGVHRNIQHYKALLQVYLDNGHQFACNEIMSEIHAQRLKPDQTTYELMLEQLCRSGSMDVAMQFVNKIKSNDFQLTENIYCSLMIGYARVGNMARCLAFMDEMKVQGVEQTVHTTITLMKCYARRGDIDALIDVFDSYVIENNRIESGLILTVIAELCLNDHENKAAALVRRIQQPIGWHQLVHNTILMLISRGKIEGAYTLLKTMPRATLADGRLVEIGNFFLKQMIKNDHPVDVIIAMSRRITADGLNPRPIYIILEQALRLENVNISIGALEELRNLCEPIRQHYFWPLLCCEGTSGKEQLFKIIRQMRNEFDLTPNAQTVTNFILPHLKELPSEQIIEELSVLDIPMTTIIPPIVLHSLNQFNLNEACEIAIAYESHSIYYSAESLRKSLTTALTFTSDYAAFARLVRIVRDSLQFDQNLPNVNDKKALEEMQLNLVGSILYDVIKTLRDRHSIDLALRSFIGEGLIFSYKQRHRINTLLMSMVDCSDFGQHIDVLTDPGNRSSSKCSAKIHSNVKSDTKQIRQLMETIECGDVVGALRLWTNLKLYEQMSEREMQYFVDFLQKNNRHKEVHEIVKQAVTNKIRLSNHTWRSLLDQLASKGNVAALDEFKQIDNAGMTIPLYILNDAYCLVFTQNEKGAAYLDILMEQVNGAEKATDLNNFPLNSAITILKKHPELLEAYKTLVNKYLNKNCTVPLNALWMFYFINGNDEECKQIWTNTLSMVPNLSFDCILRFARTTNDPQLAERLLDFFRSEELDKENWIAAYNVLLDIHTTNRAINEAIIVIEYAVWDDCYEYIDSNTIISIADEMAAKGQPFPYKIPKQENK